MTSSRPSTLSLSALIDQTPDVLTASSATAPEPFGPVAENINSAWPESPSMLILPMGKLVEIGSPNALTTSELA